LFVRISRRCVSSAVLRNLLMELKVIGTAIAINILNPKIPLIGACGISVVDTLFILMFYRSDGSLRRLRVFEVFVAAFVAGIFVMYCIELSYISADVGQVFKGYLPSREIFVSSGYVLSPLLSSLSSH
jgi:metal iron transporter